MTQRLTLLLLLFPMLAAASSEIVRFSSQKHAAIVTHPAERHWKVSDYVCAAKESPERICGVILVSNAKGAIVQWDPHKFVLAKGDILLEPSKTPKRPPGKEDKAEGKSSKRFIADENPKIWDEVSPLTRSLLGFEDTPLEDRAEETSAQEPP